jgi:hypothetical protein
MMVCSGTGTSLAWLDRCYLLLRVGEVSAFCSGRWQDISSTLILDDGVPISVAQDLTNLIARKVQKGDLICVGLSREGLADAIDFVDGRPSLVGEQLASAAAEARRNLRRS